MNKKVIVILSLAIIFASAEDYFTVKGIVLMMTKLISKELKEIKSQIRSQLKSRDDKNYFINTSELKLYYLILLLLNFFSSKKDKHNQYIQKLSSCKTEIECKRIFEEIMKDTENKYKLNNRQNNLKNRILFRISRKYECNIKCTS
jgi:hypothetical protein